MHPVQTVTQGLKFWVRIYHLGEEAMQGITDARMLDGLDKCRNEAVQQTLHIPILDIEADSAEECDLVDKEYATAGDHITV